MRHNAYGTLKYKDNYILNVTVDVDLVNYYRSLIPIVIDRQKYEPHITVIRKEIIPNLALWNKYEGKVINFEYDNHIYDDTRYWWLHAYCKDLETIRVELGLPPATELTKPPDGADCFHITLGNIKYRVKT